MKKILLLVNAAAGTGAARNIVYEAVEGLSVRECLVTVLPILPGKGMSAEHLIGEHGAGYDAVMCAGGDGTLSHVIQGILKAGLKKPVAYLPCGSANDYAKSLGIPASMEEICAAAAGMKTASLDVGIFNDRWFNYVAAFGAFTKVSYSTSREVKNFLGYAAYILEGIRTLPENISTRSMLRITHDGVQEEGEYLFGSVSNSTSLGGMPQPLIQRARLDDGLFEVMLIRAPENLVEIGDIISTLAAGSTDSPYVHMFRTDSLQIEALSETAWTLDGEYGGTPRNVQIEVCRRAVKLLVP